MSCSSLKAVAGGLVLVDSGEAVLEQGALEVVAGGRVGTFRVDFVERLIDLLVQTQFDSGLRDFLGLGLRGVADGLVGMDAVEEPDLGTGGHEIGDGVVVGAESCFRSAGALVGEEPVNGLLVTIETALDPGFQVLGVRLGSAVQG